MTANQLGQTQNSWILSMYRTVLHRTRYHTILSSAGPGTILYLISLFIAWSCISKVIAHILKFVVHIFWSFCLNPVACNLCHVTHISKPVLQLMPGGLWFLWIKNTELVIFRTLSTRPARSSQFFLDVEISCCSSCDGLPLNCKKEIFPVIKLISMDFYLLLTPVTSRWTLPLICYCFIITIILK
jgi:hypothetical protein